MDHRARADHRDHRLPRGRAPLERYRRLLFALPLLLLFMFPDLGVSLSLSLYLPVPAPRSTAATQAALSAALAAGATLISVLVATGRHCAEKRGRPQVERDMGEPLASVPTSIHRGT